MIVCPKNFYEESPDVSDLPNVGVVGKIKSKIELPNGNIRIVVSGQKRVKISAKAILLKEWHVQAAA